METDAYIYASIGLVGIAAYVLKKLDASGTLLGIVLASIFFSVGCLPVVVALLLFFLAGTLASKWKFAEKQRADIAQENQGIRGIANVWGNGGAAFLLLQTTWLGGYWAHGGVFMAIACLASACADTLASELGNVYGQRYIHVISGQRAQRGVDGAISLEGTLASFVGSALVAITAWWVSPSVVVVFGVWLGGILGCLADSILGAVWERNGILNNHSVNFWSTFLGGLIAGLFIFLVNS